MKKAFILSCVLHLSLASTLWLFMNDKTEIKKEVFYADLVRPESGQEDKHARPMPIPKPQVSPREVKPLPKPSSKPTTKMQSMAKHEGGKIPAFEKGESITRNDQVDVGSQKRQEQPIGKPSDEPSLPTPIPPPERQGVITERKTFREKLFDRDVIKEVARAERPLPEKDSSITFDTKEFKYHGYLKRLRERIEGVWRYPQEAAERGIYGDLYLRFTIKKNGRLGDIELVRTSGYKVLDDAAIRALRDADPFWPLPDELGKEAFTITGHFVYSLYGVYLR